MITRVCIYIFFSTFKFVNIVVLKEWYPYSHFCCFKVCSFHAIFRMVALEWYDIELYMFLLLCFIDLWIRVLISQSLNCCKTYHYLVHQFMFLQISGLLCIISIKYWSGVKHMHYYPISRYRSNQKAWTHAFYFMVHFASLSSSPALKHKSSRP